MKRFPLLALLAAAALLAGCHNSGRAQRQSSPPTSSTTPIATAPSALPPGVATMLQKYAVTPPDLPSGYSLGLQLEVPNGQAAADYGDPQGASKEIQTTGRIGGVGQQILAPPNLSQQIGVSVELFRDAAGAQQWAADPPGLATSLNPMTVDAGPGLGEAASALRWSQAGKDGYVVNFSRGRVVYGIGVTAATAQESQATAMEIARRLDGKAQRQAS